MSCVAVPVLPVVLVTEALMVSSPLPNACKSAAGTLTLQLKSGCTVAVYWLPPSVTVTVFPACAVPVTWPLIVWLTPLSAALIMSSPATVLMITPGRSDSTFTVWVVAPLLPALSVALALIWYTASPNAPTAEAGTVTLQLPALSVVALYASPFNITVTVVPVARPLDPPLMIRSWVFSVLLMMSSPETVLMVNVGPLRSTVTS